MELDDLQRRAVLESVKKWAADSVGRSRHGKTTTINTMIHYFEKERNGYPAGGAYRKGSQTDDGGHQAMRQKTIHRLLELNSLAGERRAKRLLERNEEKSAGNGCVDH